MVLIRLLVYQQSSPCVKKQNLLSVGHVMAYDVRLEGVWVESAVRGLQDRWYRSFIGSEGSENSKHALYWFLSIGESPAKTLATVPVT